MSVHMGPAGTPPEDLISTPSIGHIHWDLPEEKVRYAIICEYEVESTGPRYPEPPSRRHGLRAWLTMANRRAYKQWHRSYTQWRKDYRAWLDAGCPPDKVRMYIPDAEIGDAVQLDPATGAYSFSVTAHAADWHDA